MRDKIIFIRLTFVPSSSPLYGIRPENIKFVRITFVPKLCQSSNDPSVEGIVQTINNFEFQACYCRPTIYNIEQRKNIECLSIVHDWPKKKYI